MGNIHAVNQKEPFEARGVAIRVIRKYHDAVKKMHGSLGDQTFYTYLKSAKITLTLIPRNSLKNSIVEDELLYFMIEDGMKMWCSYQEFIENIRRFAKYLEDARFVISDECESIHDEFIIADQKLKYNQLLDQ